MRRRKSLTRRLLRKLFSPVFGALIIVCLMGYLTAVHEIDEVYDSEMITEANTLWLTNKDNLEDERGTIKIRVRHIDLPGIQQELLNNYAHWRAFRVWKDGYLIMESDNARPVDDLVTREGFEDYVQDGERWRSFTLHIPEANVVVEIMEKHAARFELVQNIAGGLMWPLLFTLPLIGFFVWRGVHSGLNDLRLFADAIQRRSSDDMSKLDIDRTPVEILPLAENLNQLLAKLEASLVHERLFMDNAAHELRTPLAALSIQTDVALSAKSEVERLQALTELAGGVTRASRLVDQMLVLGRLKHQVKPSTSLILYDVVRQVVKEHVTVALHKYIAISVTGDEKLQGFSQAGLLLTLLNNLLENAIKYTPARGKVMMDVGMRDQRPFVTITDTGPGIPESEREKVFERFYRISEESHTGSGLGLAIVKHIAELLSIDVQLENTEHKGLQVTLLFPVTEFSEN